VVLTQNAALVALDGAQVDVVFAIGATEFLVFGVAGHNVDLFGGVDGVDFLLEHQLIFKKELLLLKHLLVLKAQLTLTQ
jgi:hypothetical protein